MGKGTVGRCGAVLTVLLAMITPAVPAAAAPAAPSESQTAPGTAEPDLPEPLSPAARAAALAEPAIVAVEVRWHGYVRDRSTGGLVDAEPVTASAWCSGVGIGGAGYLLTIGSCLEPAAVAREAVNQIVQRRVAEGRIPADQADQQLSDLLATATIGPVDATASPPERSVFVRRAVTDDEPMHATVVSVADPDAGDAAILKINRSSQPILPLAEDAAVGDELVVVDCRQAQSDTSTGTASPAAAADAVQTSFRTSVVAENDPHVLLDQETPQQPFEVLPGGIVITENAAFVGILDGTLGGRDRLVDASVVRDLLDEAEVNTNLGQVDRDYRAGFDEYYAGQYTESIEHFDSVLAIIPSHLQAHEYRNQAQERREAQGADDPPPPNRFERMWHRFNHFVTARSGSIVGIGVLIAILVFLMHSRRPVHAIAPGSVQTPPEAPVSPPAIRSPEPRESDPTNA